MAKVFFLGAGPGDPELITLKGYKLLKRADVVIYAGSLINKEVLKFTKRDAILIDSAYLNLKEIIEIIKKNYQENKLVLRLHSGDPSIYGAIYEQMIELDKLGIDYEIVPGISSMQLASAKLRIEYTAPQLAQTIVITRIEGKTPIPPGERLDLITKSKATYIFFLSALYSEKIKEIFYLNGWQKDTPVAVLYKLGFKDEKIIKTTLENLTSTLKEHKITRHALIVIGDVLEKSRIKAYSKLYDSNFNHAYRK